MSDRVSSNPVMLPIKAAAFSPLASPTTTGAPMVISDSTPRRRSRLMIHSLEKLAPRAGLRTSDPAVNSRLLYQLSYRGASAPA